MKTTLFNEALDVVFNLCCLAPFLALIALLA